MNDSVWMDWWIYFYDDTVYYEAYGSGSTISFTPPEQGSYYIEINAYDDYDGYVYDSRTIDVLNVAPSVSIIGVPEQIDEGNSVQLTAEVSDPGEYDTIFTYDWQIFKDGHG